MVDFPQRRLAALHELGARVFESRKVGSANESTARQLLLGFHDVCMQTGLDRVLSELAADVADRAALADNEAVLAALVAQLETADLDGGGPRNAKPKVLATCLVTALGLAIVEEPDRAIALPDEARRKLVAAIASVVDVELAAATMREAIVADARARCEERFHTPFNRIVAQLDDRGLQMLKQPKVPVEAMQAVQQALVAAREVLVDRVVRAAIDRATGVLDAETVARLDQPITLRATPRDVAIVRAKSARTQKSPGPFAIALLESLTDLVPIAWAVAERPARPYGARETFAMGELIDHPKFGRGEVVGMLAQRIDVEFADGMHTLVHVPLPRVKP